jgi:hypothetical protein
MVSVIGSLAWIGSVALAVCGAPLALSAWREGHAQGVDGWMVVFWLVGEAMLLPYLVIQAGVGPAVADAAVNLVFASIVAYYKLKPGSDLAAADAVGTTEQP